MVLYKDISVAAEELEPVLIEATGFVTDISGNEYYYDPSSGEQIYGECYIHGYWYYIDEESGVKATGWTQHHGHQYYYD